MNTEEINEKIELELEKIKPELLEKYHEVGIKDQKTIDKLLAYTKKQLIETELRLETSPSYNLSYSRATSFFSCNKKYENTYIKKIKPAVQKPFFIFGSTFHSLLDTFYDKSNTNDPYIIMQYYLATTLDIEGYYKMKALYENYLVKYYDFYENKKYTLIECEKDHYLDFKFDGIDTVFNVKILMDKLFMTEDGIPVIMDHKTSGVKLEKFKSIQTKMQPLIYAYAVKKMYPDAKFCYFIYDGIMKISSATKIKKNETAIEFSERMMETVSLDPDKYLEMFEHKIMLDDDLEKKVTNFIYRYAAGVKQCMDLGEFSANEMSCELYGGCEYKEYCDNGGKLTENYICFSEEEEDLDLED